MVEKGMTENMFLLLCWFEVICFGRLFGFLGGVLGCSLLRLSRLLWCDGRG